MTRRILLGIAFLSLVVCFAVTISRSALSTHGLLVVANQKEHTLLLVDPDARREVAKVTVGVNGH